MKQNTMNHKQPYLYLNFKNNSKKSPLTFINPIKVIVAWSMDEIIPCLNAVQRFVESGNYAAGYLSYEAGSAFNPEIQIRKGNQMPLLWFGIYPEPITQAIKSRSRFSVKPWNPMVSIDHYNKIIDQIQIYIKQQRIKQVNYTIQLDSLVDGDKVAYFNHLEQMQSNYNAYMNIGDYTILSASPELFFHKEESKITTKPMKGTIGRGKTYEEDIQNAKWLKTSKKNRAENKMIVELMKDELKNIATPGSINASNLYDIEKHSTVYQMTSTITADLKPHITTIDILKELFPCGSITGLPKKEAMNVIHELEKDPREVYCGAMGYITPTNEAIFNVPIRTVQINNNNGKARYGVGGAITFDSTKEEEYQEILTKAKLLKTRKKFKLLETLGLYDGEYLVLENHLTRLTQTAAYFDFKLDKENVKSKLRKIAKNYPNGRWMVRLVAGNDGGISIDISEITPSNQTVTCTLSHKPINQEDPFLYHKTTNRDIYTEHKQVQPDLYDVLLWNKDQEITEFTTGNIVIELNGRLITPPITSGLLPGTFRSYLLKTHQINEEIIQMDDLQKCQNIWFINSVRKWIAVNLI